MKIHLNFNIGDTLRIPWKDGTFVAEEIVVKVRRSSRKLAQCVPYSISTEYRQVDPPTMFIHQANLTRVKRGPKL